MTPAAVAGVRLIAKNAAVKRNLTPPRWLPGCGAETPVLDWRERLVCSRCGSRQVDMVARVKCARSPLLPPRPVYSSGPGRGKALTGRRPSVRRCTGSA